MVTAVVDGSEYYTVTLETQWRKKTATIMASCDCPYRETHGGFCKHIWATLLAVEKDHPEFLQPDGKSPQTIRLDFGWLDDDWADGDFEEDDSLDRSWRAYDEVAQRDDSYRQPDRRAVHAHSRRAPSQRSAPVSSWRKLLKRVAQDQKHIVRPDLSVPDERPIEPIYILEGQDVYYSNEPILSLAHRQMTKSGKLGKVKPLKLSPNNLHRIANAEDRACCMALLGAPPKFEYSGYSYHSQTGVERSDCKLTPFLQDELFPRIADSGRFFFRPHLQAELQPLTWDAEAAWEFTLIIQPAGDGRQFELCGRLQRGGEQRELAAMHIVSKGQPALGVLDGRLSRFESHQCYSWLDSLRESGAVRMTHQDLPKLLTELAKLQQFPPIQWPSQWNVEQSANTELRPELVLGIESDAIARRSYPVDATILFHYGDCQVRAGAPGAYLVRPEKAQLVVRQRDAELRLVRRLVELGAEQQYINGLAIRPKKIPEMVRTLLAEDWLVRAMNLRYRKPADIEVQVSSGIDWFDLDGHVAYDDQAVALPTLLQALDKGETFVRLGDGSLGLLPEAWLRRHRRWLSFGEVQSDRVRFAQNQISLIDALIAELPEIAVDEQVAAAREKLNRFNGIKPRKPVQAFHGELRHYQCEGLGWLRFLEDFGWSGCLADDMGLGKTVQVLALLANRRRYQGDGPSLIVAPKSLVFNWQREAERFTPQLKVLNYTGLARKAEREQFTEYDLVLTTYGTLRRDIAFLKAQPFNYAVLDEAQAIKNPHAQSAKAARLLSAQHRLALTGTPIENDWSDVWSLFEFLNPGMLGTLATFKGLLKPDAPDSQENRGETMVQRMVRPFILRRTKSQVAPELPPRSEQTILCDLSGKQKTYYRELCDHYRASLMKQIDAAGMQRSKMHILEALLRLRQAACHPGLIDDAQLDVAAAKFETLLPMLDELVAEGHKGLVFSQFTSLLAILRRHLDQRGLRYEYLDGNTRDRERCIEHFQTDESCPLFLISLKAGGFGLNLTAAGYVFILDPWWNPAVEAQAIDRAHRIGQDKTVMAYRLIASNTVESKILELQQRKRKLAEAIISEQNSVIRTLTREDLRLLLE